jgi:dienelactone hydrolase
MRRFVLLLAIALVGMSAFAQEQTNVAQEKTKFLMRAGERMTGSEEFTVRKTESGYEIDGETVIKQRVPVEAKNASKQELREQHATHHTVLNNDWTLASYKNTTQAPAGAFVYEAKASDKSVTLSITWPAGTRERSFPVTGKTFILENFVPSQMEAALRANTPEGTFNAVVPTNMDHFEAKVTKLGGGEGTLTGKNVKVTKFTVTGGGPLIEVWTDDASGDLMRLYVPSQDVEYLRDGFKLTSTGEAAKPKVNPPAGVVEREVHFTSAGLDFPATLTMPEKTSSKVPVLVFVHGSGAHDRDETIGENKPFRDLAWGLAQRGIASLRYDKRAYLYPERAGISLDTQVIADAAAAVEFAGTLDGVDGKRVFLLGHSLGASLAPYIAERVPVHGIVMMASPARGMNEVIKDQIRLMLKSQGKSDEEIAKVIAQQDKVAQDVLAGRATETEVGSQVPLPLFKDMLSRDPAGELKNINLPVLVLQGGKDAQVFASDFDALKEIVKDKPGSQAKMFKGLSHLFMPVEGAPDVYDALKPGHVAPEVIETIAAWVKKVE